MEDRIGTGSVLTPRRQRLPCQRRLAVVIILLKVPLPHVTSPQVGEGKRGREL